MKRLFVLTLVVALLVIAVTPAFAAGGRQAGNAHGARWGAGNSARNSAAANFALAGTIASLDPASGAVTVKVVGGNILVKDYIGQNLSIGTSASTRYLLRNPDGTATPVSFADLAVGQKVSVSGILADSVWTATRITVGAKLVHLP